MAGANDFLTKPFSSTELHVRLKNLVESHQLERQLSRQKQVLEATLDELKETELQLVQAEKMASLGRMSAGIIHEINNPLNYAKTGMFTLRRKSAMLPESERADYDDIVKDIEDGLTRVAGIITDLRAFTHPGAAGVDDIDMQELTDSALRFLSAEWKDHVKVANEVPEGFEVEGNRNKLLQVVTNLLQNAFDSVRKRHGDDESKGEVRIAAEDLGPVRVVRIWDNGHGIKRADLSRIFDPFFTTKDVGEGTGLGLSICYRIMSDSGGRITVRSEEGEYCEFTLEFVPSRPAHN
jgi:C4-dicarboxylate-specific signal transduction histidine kinase